MQEKQDIQNLSHTTKIKNLREALKYTYYRFNEFYRRTEGYDYKYSAILLLSTFLILNFSTFIYLFLAFIPDNYLFLPTIKPIYLNKFIYGGGLIFISLLIAHILVQREPYKKIYQRFSRESHTLRKKRGWFVVGYIALTFVLFFSSALFMDNNHSEEWTRTYNKDILSKKTGVDSLNIERFKELMKNNGKQDTIRIHK